MAAFTQAHEHFQENFPSPSSSLETEVFTGWIPFQS